jgi:hypothetical protein
MARRTPPTAAAPPGHAGVARLVQTGAADLSAPVRTAARAASAGPATAVLGEPRARAATTAPTRPVRGADSYPDTTSTAGSAAVGGAGWVQSRVWGVEP